MLHGGSQHCLQSSWFCSADELCAWHCWRNWQVRGWKESLKVSYIRRRCVWELTALTALLGLCPHRAQLFHELQHTTNNSLWADIYSKQPKWGINKLPPAVNACGETRFGPDDHREQVLSNLSSIVSSFANTLWFLVLPRTDNKCDWTLSGLLPLYLSLFLLNMVDSPGLPFSLFPLLNCRLSITSLHSSAYREGGHGAAGS